MEGFRSKFRISCSSCGSGEGGGDDEFYEKIEAPKFVDFTLPEQRRSADDRYWFCMRFGCDQKHEEEIDYEEISKNFVLRVMAARSPNVRLQKALSRKGHSAHAKCPLTAPPKSSKTRIPRLALLTSQKSVDSKRKIKSILKPRTPSNTEAKKSSAVSKALTTPRNKKGISNLGSFRSVRNPNTTTAVAPQSRTVAKALVFHSPKKTAKLKSSSQLDGNMSSLCSGMKKLDISSAKRHLKRFDKPSDSSRKQLRGREVKSRVYDSLCVNNYKDRDLKAFSGVKKKTTDEQMLCEAAENESSDMEIDEKSRNGSLELCPIQGASTGDGKANHYNPLTTKCPENLVKPSKAEELDADLSDTTRSSRNPPSNSQEQRIEDEKNNKGNNWEEEEAKLYSKKAKTQSNDKEEVVREKETINQFSEDDDKENASSSKANRRPNLDNSYPNREALGNKETSKKTKKVSHLVEKRSTHGTGGAQLVKYKKPKPTNPKPFRLRTDERRILKEANLEKKLLLSEPVNKKVQEGVVTSKTTCSGISKEFQDQSSTNSPKRNPTPTKLLQKCRKHKEIRHIEVVPKTVRSPNSKQNKMRCQSQRGTPSQKGMVSIMTTGQLAMIPESSKLLRKKEVEKQCKSDASPVEKASALRSMSRGKRRPATIPKEPIFHKLHVPKSCSRKVA